MMTSRHLLVRSSTHDTRDDDPYQGPYATGHSEDRRHSWRQARVRCDLYEQCRSRYLIALASFRVDNGRSTKKCPQGLVRVVDAAFAGEVQSAGATDYSQSSSCLQTINVHVRCSPPFPSFSFRLNYAMRLSRWHCVFRRGDWQRTQPHTACTILTSHSLTSNHRVTRVYTDATPQHAHSLHAVLCSRTTYK